MSIFNIYIDDVGVIFVYLCKILLVKSSRQYDCHDFSFAYNFHLYVYDFLCVQFPVFSFCAYNLPEYNLHQTYFFQGTLADKNRFYKILLGMRNRVDGLLRILYPLDLPRPSSRFLQWMFTLILGHSNHFIQQLRSFIHECGMSLYDFAANLQDVYKDDANKPIHDVKAPPCSLAELEAAFRAADMEVGSDLSKQMLKVLFRELDFTKVDNKTGIIN